MTRDFFDSVESRIVDGDLLQALQRRDRGDGARRCERRGSASGITRYSCSCHVRRSTAVVAARSEHATGTGVAAGCARHVGCAGATRRVAIGCAGRKQRSTHRAGAGASRTVHAGASCHACEPQRSHGRGAHCTGRADRARRQARCAREDASAKCAACRAALIIIVVVRGGETRVDAGARPPDQDAPARHAGPSHDGVVGSDATRDHAVADNTVADASSARNARARNAADAAATFGSAAGAASSRAAVSSATRVAPRSTRVATGTIRRGCTASALGFRQ